MSGGSATTAGPPGEGKARVYVVDDHPLMRRSIVEAIEREEGMAVCGQAADAPEALGEILAIRPELVLTDIQLKTTSGLDLIRDLLAQAPGTKIVATTMFDVRRNERLARAAGAVGFVPKQDGPENLIAVVRAALATGV